MLDYTQYNNKIANPDLAARGRALMQMAEHEMRGLMAMRAEYGPSQPLAGARITGSLHMTVETAVLIETLVALGAEVRWASCNVLSTNDAAAAALVAEGLPIFAFEGETVEEYWACLAAAFTFEDGTGPDLIVDDGGDAALMLHEGVAAELEPTRLQREPTSDEERWLFAALASRRTSDPTFWRRTLDRCRGLSEETTTGVHRLAQRQARGTLRLPAINVNDAVTKSKFDNVYGCRESLVDAIKRATDLMIATKTAVVCGYGHVGKGSAEALAMHRARVLVTEVDPICALQAAMAGHQVVRIEDALPVADIYVTATGNEDVITAEHMSLMKDGAVVCNIGHFDHEVQVRRLEARADVSKTPVKPGVDRYTFDDGRSVYVLAEGRLVNLGCATGHPAFVMSCSFSNQVLAQIDLWTNNHEPGLHRIAQHLDEHVARLHLETIGGRLTTLTPAQAAYIGVDESGPYKSETYRY